jgi:phosphohistidine phosphatase
MRLYIVRHAFAGQHGDPAYPDDSLRPLTDEGRKQFRKLVKQLAERGFGPTLVATSPYVRCRQTAEIIAKQVDGCGDPIELSELQPGSELEALVAWTQRQQADEIAWVGHAPDVDRLTATLIGDKTSAIHFGKGTIAAIEFPSRERLLPGQGELRWLVTTKILGC